MNLLNQLIRNRFASLVVQRVFLEHAGFAGPVFENLSGELDEVAWDVRARQRLVFGVGQQAMERVTELVE